MPEPILIGLECPRCAGWLRVSVDLSAGEVRVLTVECTTGDCPVTVEDVHGLLVP